MSSAKRLQTELKEMKKSPPAMVTADLVNDSDLYKWRADIKGPQGTPYEGGTFRLTIDIPSEYPFKPPHIAFETKICHPNVQNGEICLDILSPTRWTPSMTIASTLVSLVSLLNEPNYHGSPEFIVKVEKEKAVLWTKMYAKPQEAAKHTAKK